MERNFAKSRNVLFLALSAVALGAAYHPSIKWGMNAAGLRWLYILAISFSAAYLFTPLAALISKPLGALDEPNERKMHTVATPRLGGLAIYFSLATAMLFNFHLTLEIKGILLGSTLILIVGVMDDIVGLPAIVKLLGQMLATAVVVAYGVRASFMPSNFLGDAAEVIITFIWIVGITNALNFFDGMDGLAAGLGAVSSFFIGLIAIQTGQKFLMFLSIPLFGSCLGFLPYNFKWRGRAEIFLGDGGSTLIGFVLASLAIMGGWGRESPVKTYTMPTLILGVLIFDMTHITVSRIWRGQVRGFRDWLEFTAKDHLHHRIEALGLGQKETVLLIYSLSAAFGISAVILKDGRVIDALLLMVQAFALLFIMAIFMRRGAEANRNFPAGKDEAIKS